jgi:sporulation protein YunB
MSAIARKKTEVLATEIINQVLVDVLAEQCRYSSIIYLEKDASGRIVFMQPNLVMVNQIKLQALNEVQAALGTLGHMTFGIPLGRIFGSRVFAAAGPDLRVGVIPMGTAEVSVREQFEEAGINQTRHVVYLLCRARMQVMIPLHRELIEVTNEFPLVESIIVGEVPDSYFQLKWNR